MLAVVIFGSASAILLLLKSFGKLYLMPWWYCALPIFTGIGLAVLILGAAFLGGLLNNWWL